MVGDRGHVGRGTLTLLVFAAALHVGALSTRPRVTQPTVLGVGGRLDSRVQGIKGQVLELDC